MMLHLCAYPFFRFFRISFILIIFMFICLIPSSYLSSSSCVPLPLCHFHHVHLQHAPPPPKKKKTKTPLCFDWTKNRAGFRSLPGRCCVALATTKFWKSSFTRFPLSKMGRFLTTPTLAMATHSPNTPQNVHTSMTPTWLPKLFQTPLFIGENWRGQWASSHVDSELTRFGGIGG